MNLAQRRLARLARSARRAKVPRGDYSPSERAGELLLERPTPVAALTLALLGDDQDVVLELARTVVSSPDALLRRVERRPALQPVSGVIIVGSEP